MVTTSFTNTGTLYVGLNRTGPFRCVAHWRRSGYCGSRTSARSSARAYAREHGHAGMYRADGSMVMFRRDELGKVRQRTYKPADVRAKTVAEPTVITPRGFVVGCLYHSSVVRHLVPNDLWHRAYLACDGFGTLTAAQASEQCFDWSHVRDSSEEAYKRAARLLRRGFRRLPDDVHCQIYDLLDKHYSEPLAA